MVANEYSSSNFAASESKQCCFYFLVSPLFGIEVVDKCFTGFFSQVFTYFNGCIVLTPNILFLSVFSIHEA